MSASDPNLKNRDMLACNMPACKPTHWYMYLEDQRMGNPCSLHPSAVSCNPCPVQADIGMCGTPCHPFSTQRSKRFAPDSVQQHAECDIALGQFLEWMETFEPVVQIFEQVVGFSLPFTTGGTETPLSRLPACILETSTGAHGN